MTLTMNLTSLFNRHYHLGFDPFLSFALLSRPYATYSNHVTHMVLRR